MKMLNGKGRGAPASHLDLPSLTPFSLAGSGRPQLLVANYDYFSIITASIVDNRPSIVDPP